ncbi:unnamed protein product [Urochloa humidicola]
MAGFSTTTTPATTGRFFIFFSAVSCSILPAAALFFNYSSFSSSKDMIRLEGDASINDTCGCIDVTDSRLPSMSNSRGRASYGAQPMLLWDRETGEVASFTTRFSFAIVPQRQYGGIDNKGTGMAFFLAAAYPSTLPPDSEAYDMGLTGQSAGAVATGDGRFVAVEFDTFNDSIAHDPNTSYDHVGIDVNSIRSVVAESLPSFSLLGNLSAEIKYNNLSSVLQLTVWPIRGGSGSGSGSGSDDRWSYYSLSWKVDLKSELPENVSIGFSASTSTSVELHRLRSWYFSSTLEPKAAAAASPSPTNPVRRRKSGGGVVAGATVGAALLLVLLLAMAAAARRRRGHQGRDLVAGKEVDEEEGDEESGGEPMTEMEMGATGDGAEAVPVRGARRGDEELRAGGEARAGRVRVGVPRVPEGARRPPRGHKEVRQRVIHARDERVQVGDQGDKQAPPPEPRAPRRLVPWPRRAPARLRARAQPKPRRPSPRRRRRRHLLDMADEDEDHSWAWVRAALPPRGVGAVRGAPRRQAEQRDAGRVLRRQARRLRARQVHRPRRRCADHDRRLRHAGLRRPGEPHHRQG